MRAGDMSTSGGAEAKDGGLAPGEASGDSGAVMSICAGDAASDAVRFAPHPIARGKSSNNEGDRTATMDRDTLEGAGANLRRTPYLSYSVSHSVRWTTGSCRARSRSRSRLPTCSEMGACTHL